MLVLRVAAPPSQQLSQLPPPHCRWPVDRHAPATDAELCSSCLQHKSCIFDLIHTQLQKNMTDIVTYVQVKLKTEGRQKKAIFAHGASSAMESEGPPVKRKVYCTQSVFLFSIVCTLLTAVIVILGITIMKKLAYIEETEKICTMQNLYKYIISLNDKFEEFKSDISKAYQECNRNQTSENDIFKEHLLRRVCTNDNGNKGLPCFLCPVDWLQNKDMCYFISKESKTWLESRYDCIAAKGDLSEFKDLLHLGILVNLTVHRNIINTKQLILGFRQEGLQGTQLVQLRMRCLLLEKEAVVADVAEVISAVALNKDVSGATNRVTW
ncbi:C-type lectin domain family 12 member A-like [Erpetoichthys calabaricus]|uniref:C-type lectin domain family 12 member A-like n=1 Tax=Erpetoichthys calabaricus TaxID=27687 RepID=UPI00223447D8|nr:C-type lectin domain family 12 member A-like [Erpetoichthys calabaricus]